MSEPIETAENRRTWKGKFLFLIMALALPLFSVSAIAQTKWSMWRVNEDSRAKIIDQMSVEATKYRLALNRNSLTLHHTDNTLTIGMQTVDAEKARESDWRKGVDIAFVYLESNTRNSLPNGFYKIRISDADERPLRHRNSSRRRNLVASFINFQGEVVRQLPLDDDSNSGGTPQRILVRQELRDGKWVVVGYFATRFEYWAWFAGPDAPCIAC